MENISATIFKKAGFKVIQDYRKNNYQIDVLAQKGGLNIICECKQYENTHLEIRNLIHQWDSKNKELKADKIILIIYGQSPTTEELNLAKKYSITIWIYKHIDYYFNHDKKGLSKELLIDLGLKKKNLFLRFINPLIPPRYKKF